MANNVSDFLSKNLSVIEETRTKGVQQLEDFRAKNDIQGIKAQAPKQYNNPAMAIEPINELPLERKKTANMFADDLTDAASAVGQGVAGALRGATAIGATAATGYQNIYEAMTNKPLTVADTNINAVTKATGQDTAKAWLEDKESDMTKDKRIELSNIMTNPNIGEVDRAKQVSQYYLDNPDMLLLDTAKVIPQSVLEMGVAGKVLGGLAKTRQLGTAAKAGIGAGAGAYGGALAEVAADPDNELDPRSQVASLAKGALVGGVTGAFSKYLPEGDIDRVLVGGGLEQFGKGGIVKGTAKTMLREGTEEFPQEYGEQVIDNVDKGNPLIQGAGGTGIQGFLLGAAAGGVMGAPSNIAASVNNVSEAVATRDVRKNGTAEENVDPNSDKFDPIRAYKNAGYAIGSQDPTERAKAEETIAAASQSVYAKYRDYDAAIANEKNLEQQTKLIEEKAAFEKEYVIPLQAAIKNDINATKANKEQVLSNISKQADVLGKAFEQAQTSKVIKFDMDIDEMVSTRVNSPVSEDAPVSQRTANLTDGESTVWERSKLAVTKKPAFAQASERYGVPMRVITAIVAVESEGKFSAQSPTGALGLLQQTEIFRKEYGLQRGDSIGATDAAINATVDYLAKSYKQFGNWDDAILSYNAGRAGAAAYKNGTFKGSDARKKEVANYLGKVNKYLGGSQGGVVDNTTNNLGDGIVSNDTLKGLRIKGTESTINGGVRGYTAEFAQLTQSMLGSGLNRFTAFNDKYHAGKNSKHNGGQAFDFTVNGKVTPEKGAQIVAQLEAEAAAKGYKIAVIDEYTNPSKGSTGGHFHVSVLGRTNGTKTEMPVQDRVAAEEDARSYLQGDIKVEEEVTPEELQVQEAKKTFEEQKSRQARTMFSTLSDKEIENSPLYSVEQKAALRQLLAVKEKLKEGKSTNQVSKDIYEGSKGKTALESNLGIKQYDEIITQSIASNDRATAEKHLDMLSNFANNQQSKNAVIQENIEQATPRKPLFVAPIETGEWQVVDMKDYTPEEFKAAGGLQFFGPNVLSKRIASESADLVAFKDTMIEVVNKLLPVPEQATDSQQAGNEVEPLIPTENAPVMASETGNTEIPTDTTPIAQSPVSEITETQIADTEGMLPGGLGDIDSLVLSDDVQGMDIGLSESVVAPESSVMTTGTDVTSQPIDSSVGNVESSVNTAPTPTATVPTVSGVEDVAITPVEPIATYKADEVKEADTNYIDDSTFGFNNKNQYGLNTATDETLPKNQAMIDEVINQLDQDNIKYPEAGIGKQLKTAAPKTFAYLNEQVQAKFGIDNAALISNAPRTVVPNRSAASGGGKAVGKASDPIQSTKGKNELTAESTVGKKSYRNTYAGNSDKGTTWQLDVVRSSTDNKVSQAKIRYKNASGKENSKIVEVDPLISDGDIIDQIEAEYNIKQVLQQADTSDRSTVNDAPKTETVKGVTFPTEMRKATKLEDAVDTLLPYVQNDVISVKELTTYTAIIKPILNYNPGLQVRFSETVKASSYDKSSNTIYVKIGTKGSNLVQETTRMVVYSATANLAIKLEDSSYENIKAEGKDLVKLNKDLSKIKRDIERLVTLGYKSYLDLGVKEKARLLDALTSNAKLLSSATTDPAIGKFLRSVQVTEGKVKSSLFRKISNSLRTFLNIGNNDKTATLFDRMMDITARTVELQARNSEVNFKVTEQGKAGVFQDVIKEEVDIERAKPFWQRNQLVAGFTQRSDKNKPLSGVANLASKLKIDLMQGLGTLVSESPTKAQREQLIDFLQFKDEMAQHLMDTFAKKGKSAKTGADFNYQDLKGFLEHEGALDENTITAMSLAAYNWAIEFGNKNLTMDNDIKKFLNLNPDESAYIPEEIREQYQFLTGLKTYSTASLGKTVANALNIKATDFMRVEAQSAFENSLGEWALNAMQSANLIHLHSIPTKIHMANIAAVEGDADTNFRGESSDAFNENGQVTFISVAGVKGGAKNRRLEEIAFANKNTVGYMGKVFGTEIGLRAPSLTPIDKVVDSIKRTDAITSKEQTKFTKKMQDEPISIDMDMNNALNRLVSADRNTTLEMIGALVTDEALADEHKDDRASKQSAAEGILRDLENANDFIGSLPKQPNGEFVRFYDGVYGAKNNRMHYNSNMFNFQGSLLHRAIGQYDNFKSTVELTGLSEGTPKFFNDDGQLSNLGLFYKAIAEKAEGTEDIIEEALKDTRYSKGFTQDKIPGEVFLDPFYEYLSTDPLVAKAVEATKVLISKPNSVTKEQVATIAELVKFWDGKAESLRGLVEYTKLVMAQEQGQTSIETHIGIHSDGVNNGIALANVLLGTANERFLSQVGMFMKGSKYSNFFDTRLDSELQDYYEGFGTVLTEVINEVASEDNETQQTLLSLNRSFLKRPNMKALLIPFGYSAGMKRIKSLAYGQFLQDVKDTMKDLSKKDFNDPAVVAEHADLKAKLSKLTGEQIELPIGKDILEYWFDNRTINKLSQVYTEQLGDVVQEAMERYAEDFIRERDLNVRIQGAASDAYLTAKDIIENEGKEAYINSLVTDSMSKSQATKLYKAEGMPAKYYIENIQPKLKAILPTVKTAYNHDSDSNEGSFITLNEKSTLTQDTISKAMGYKVDANGNLVTSTPNIAVAQRIEESTGVGTNSQQVQGMDAYIAGWTSARGGNVNINVHDAGISGLSNFRDMVNMQNKATYEGLRDYAMQTQSLKTLIDTLTSVAESMGPKLYREELLNTIKGITGNALEDTSTKSINKELKKIIDHVRASQANKINIIRNLETVHQYAGEGSPYVTSEADTKLVDAAESKANKLLDSMESIFEFNNKIFKEKSEPVVNESVTGTATELRAMVDGLIVEAGAKVGESRKALLSYVLDRVDNVNSSLTFEWVDSITTPDGSQAQGVFDGLTNSIKLSRSKIDSLPADKKVTVIAHELIHAVSAQTIRESNDPEVRAAIDQLNLMLAELQSVNQNKFTTNRELQNVEELIAYGLTEGNFLKFIGENLKNDYILPKVKANKGLPAFIAAVSKFFKGKKAATEKVSQFIRLADIVTRDTVSKQQSITLYSVERPSEVLKSLDSGSMSSDFSEHLDGLINGVIRQFYERSPRDGKLVRDTIDNVSTRALVAGFRLSDKELHVMEILKVTGASYLNDMSGSKTADKMRQIYKNAMRQLTVDDFLADPSNATKQERAIATKQFNYLTKHDSLNKKEHLERFFAIALASEQVRDILNKQENKLKAEKQGTWFNKLMAIFADVVSWLTSKAMRTDGLSTPAELDVLFNNLANIDAKARANREHLLDRVYTTATSLVATPANWTVNKLVTGLFQAVDFTNSKTTSTSALSSVLRAVSMSQRTGVMANVDTLVNNNAIQSNKDGSGRLTGFGEVLNELARNSGMKSTVEELIRMVSKAGQNRDTVKRHTKQVLTSYFKDKTKELDTKTLSSITQVALRTDMSSLMNNGFSVSRVLTLLNDDNQRLAEISKLEARIADKKNGNDMLMQTKSLALYMAKEAATEHMVKNAEAIATGLGSWYEIPLRDMDTKLRDDIDVLASLYSVGMTGANEKAALRKLIADDSEAMKAVLKSHRDMAAQGKADFVDNPYNYSKGYMPQETHHLRSLRFASSLEEIEQLKREGWSEITPGDLGQDRLDGTDARTLMFHKDMSYQDYVSGALDMKDTHSKGTVVYDHSSPTELNKVHSAKMAARRKRAAERNYMSFNPQKMNTNVMIATYDTEGLVADYSYEMGGELRDKYLERNNNAIDLLGIYQSNLAFKPQVKDSQVNLARSLYADFAASYSNDPRLFVTIDPYSKDPNVQMMWRMMPYAFKQEAAKLFGADNPIVVRSDVYNAVFGFRAYSLSEMFNKVSGEKNGIEKLITTVLSAIFQDKAQMRVIQGERSWQYAISQIKDFVVIRNIKVLIGNLVANSLLLSLQGIKPVQQAKDFVSVWRNGGQYRKLAARIVEIDAEIVINKSRPAELTRLKREKNRAMREMERNPMHDFMEAGLMSTIIEDVKIGKDDNEFKSDFEQKLDDIADKLPRQVVTAFNWAVTNPGTPIHDFMSHSTQFSDLAAKYSLATNMMRQGISMKDAVAEAQSNFINYDVPTSQGLDYMNRMGLFMFTKFFLRFQQVIAKLLREKAGSTIAQHMAVEHFTGLSGVMDPFALTRLGNNPFEPGILNYNDSFNNISTIDAITSIW